MRVKIRWFATFAALSLTGLAGSIHAAECSAMSGCAAKVCEVEALMDQARKEGNMRRLATLADIRTEALRCDSDAGKKKPDETVAKK